MKPQTGLSDSQEPSGTSKEKGGDPGEEIYIGRGRGGERSKPMRALTATRRKENTQKKNNNLILVPDVSKDGATGQEKSAL